MSGTSIWTETRSGVAGEGPSNAI